VAVAVAVAVKRQRQRQRGDVSAAAQLQNPRLKSFNRGSALTLKRALAQCSVAISGAMSSETTLMTLIRMATPGPEVSLKGSPTVSPMTAALWASERFG
jgi:hypothetical protein